MGTRELELHCQIKCVVDFDQEEEIQYEQNMSKFALRNWKGKLKIFY